MYEQIYERKKEFVAKLEPALIMLDDVKSAEYKNLGFGEYVKVEIAERGNIYINVTGDSLGALVTDVVRTLNIGSSDALVRGEAEIDVIEGFWYEL